MPFSGPLKASSQCHKQGFVCRRNPPCGPFSTYNDSQAGANFRTSWKGSGHTNMLLCVSGEVRIPGEGSRGAGPLAVHPLDQITSVAQGALLRATSTQVVSTVFCAQGDPGSMRTVPSDQQGSKNSGMPWGWRKVPKR